MQSRYTAAGEALGGIPWDAYPRPRMVRKEWQCLNGKWDFSHGDAKGQILVPFCPESLLSGMTMRMEYGKEMLYSRSFTLPEAWRGRKILLHFGAVSRMAVVRVNGKGAAVHGESYLPFSADITELLRNHPSICLWTIFNEGWGQFEADDAYRRLRSLDGTRFIDSTSGWFEQELSDVESLHIYFRSLRTGKRNRPQLLSEFGGWSFKIPEHSFNLEKTYGYRKFMNREAFVRDLRALYLEQVLPLIRKGLCAAVYTQVSDVEDETNGLLTYDRRLAKVMPEELRDVSDRLLAAWAEETQESAEEAKGEAGSVRRNPNRTKPAG